MKAGRDRFSRGLLPVTQKGGAMPPGQSSRDDRRFNCSDCGVAAFANGVSGAA